MSRADLGGMAYREKVNFWGNGLTRGSGPTKRDFRSTGMVLLWKWSTGRRAVPEGMVCREKGNSWGNGLTRGSGPTKRDFRSTGMFSLWKWSTDRRVGPTMSYWEKGSPGRNGPWAAWRFRGNRPWVTWRFRESGPPSTRKGYAAAVSGKAANGGRRAAAPTGSFIGASAAAERGAGPFDNHQNPR